MVEQGTSPPRPVWCLLTVSRFMSPPETPTMVGRPSSRATTAEWDSKLRRKGAELTTGKPSQHTNFTTLSPPPTPTPTHLPPSFNDQPRAQRVKGYPAWVSAGSNEDFTSKALRVCGRRQDSPHALVTVHQFATLAVCRSPRLCYHGNRMHTCASSTVLTTLTTPSTTPGQQGVPLRTLGSEAASA